MAEFPENQGFCVEVLPPKSNRPKERRVRVIGRGVRLEGQAVPWSDVPEALRSALATVPDYGKLDVHTTRSGSGLPGLDALAVGPPTRPVNPARTEAPHRRLRDDAPQPVRAERDAAQCVGSACRGRGGQYGHPPDPARPSYRVEFTPQGQVRLVDARGHAWTRRDGQDMLFNPQGLKASDTVLAVRPGAVFERIGNDPRLAQYAQKVQGGLGSTPDINRNPYSFAAWAGEKPWQATEPLKAGHEAETDGRLHGKIVVELSAVTPVFVPSSSNPEVFFECHNGARIQKAIPGSTVKGCVRSLFEALTNSRCGVSSREQLGQQRDRKTGKWLDQRPALYRRRAPRLYQVTRMPAGGLPGKAVRCAFEYLDIDRGPATSVNVIGRPGGDKISAADLPAAVVVPWRANTFWVSKTHHRHHGKIGIAILPCLGDDGRPIEVELPCEVWNRFLGMKGHDHLRAHPKNVQQKGRNERTGYWNNLTPGYVPTRSESAEQSYQACERDIFGLRDDGSEFALVHGFDDGRQLLSIGRNFNYLWPAEKTAGEMARPFLARDEDEAALAGSDPAEATFGFIGNHRSPQGAHPFRGRVRFTPFWAWGPAGTDDPKELDRVALMPLVAPAGTKVKARPLYLAPCPSGLSADWGDGADVRLRGRKFYWHQKPHPDCATDGIANQHRRDWLERAPGPTVPENMKVAPFRPLAAGTRFTGEVHFSNLTPAELGALLVSIDPSLAFQQDASSTKHYGIKIGKAKPRGLGSVTAQVTVHVLRDASERYRSLLVSEAAEADAGLFVEPAEGDPAAAASGASASPPHSKAALVAAYRKWAQDQAPSVSWDSLEFVQDLRNLLRIPATPSVRVYPPRFDQYGWLPDWREPHGEPEGGCTRRPPAMSLARCDPHTETDEPEPHP